MHIVTELSEWQAIRKTLANKTIGFVPTMGNLHAGHGSLFARSKKENDVTIMSIFVNPTQFNEKKDFEKYPRTLQQDIDFLTSYDIDYLWAPDEKTLYTDQYQVQVNEIEISRVLEGEYRPGHFTGMLTVVLKLLNAAQPTRAYFGEKDYQQLLLIKKMVNALLLPIDIVACETVRADDGLALSSRNTRLSTAQREKAAHFPRLLRSELSLDEITSQLTALGFKVDYIVEQWGRRLGAVWLTDVRLIDNVAIISS